MKGSDSLCIHIEHDSLDGNIRSIVKPVYNDHLYDKMYSLWFIK